MSVQLARRQPSLAERLFPDSKLFRFSVKSVKCVVAWCFFVWLLSLFVCLFFHGKTSSTMSECRYQDGPQNNFVLVRLKRLQVQSSFPEEIVRGFSDLLMYV